MAIEQPQVVVAGHLCIDIIPQFGETIVPLDILLRPGNLTRVGPAVFSTGGAVSNTGLALHRLGVPVKLMGKIGSDLFGDAILGVLRGHDPALAAGMIVSADEASSYTLVINPPGIDRIFIHCPGTNDTFGVDDIPIGEVRQARIFHFGYPPLMRRLYLDEGAELVALMRMVKAAGVVTSLDMSQPDPTSEAGHVNWAKVLEQALPHVDIFVPNLSETLFMIDRPQFDAINSGTVSPVPDGALLHAIADRLLAMGAAIVGLKLGDLGLYLRTTPDRARLESLTGLLPTDLSGWLDREIFASCFRVKEAGTTGAGDCTIAGLLTGLLYGQSIEAVITSAVAVGASSVERSDAISGVPHWDNVLARVRAGWGHHRLAIALPGWHGEPDGHIWYGPHDTGR
jgi:sugar/nucleoside kinase (ribokinase family)